ncbi:MAG TPA: hypothetical protein VMF50_15690 [Candidatus Binataceae bacterium]|nr:hypothetical protein [Candidatus Binataceae bacterium]
MIEALNVIVAKHGRWGVWKCHRRLAARRLAQVQAYIDYRPIIWTLVRKPGTFARYRWREELFPSLVFRRAYNALRSRLGERADAEYIDLAFGGEPRRGGRGKGVMP